MGKRYVGMIIVGVAAALLAVSVLTNSWFSGTIRGNELSVGLRSAEACPSLGPCETETLSAFEGAPGRFQWFVFFGDLTFWGGLGVVVSLVSFVTMAGLRNPKTPGVSKLVLIWCVVLTLSGLVFLINKPELFPNPSWSIALFMAGIMGAIIGVPMLGRRELYPSDEPDPDQLAEADREEMDGFGGTFGL